MTAVIPSFNYFQKIIEVLDEILNTVNLETDVAFTRFNTPQELMADIAWDIEKLKSQDRETLAKLYHMFSPTGTYQELSISNGWGDEYLQLAQKFDLYFQKLKAQ
jgi:hypothetical protein